MAAVLGSIVLLVCLAALAVAAGIVFILVGPLPVNRKVAIVSRIQPLPTAAAPVAMGSMPIFDPAQASFSPVMQPAQPVAVAVEPPPPPARKQKPMPPIAPVQLRRPRSGPAPVLRGSRMARGTEQGARTAATTSSFDVEHTAPEAPMFEVDDPTFLEDGH